MSLLPPQRVQKSYRQKQIRYLNTVLWGVGGGSSLLTAQEGVCHRGRIILQHRLNHQDGVTHRSLPCSSLRAEATRQRSAEAQR